jgi:sporadic carbohydrate cluster protein (TIGR04323 family)
MKSLRGYIFSRDFMGERCHQSTQNLVIRDYCQKHNYKYLLSGTEYSIKNSFLMLQNLVTEMPIIDGIVAYSLFQMPENSYDRQDFYKTVIDNKGEIHFALENLKITNFLEIDRVEKIWKVQLTLKDCIKGIK